MVASCRTLVYRGSKTRKKKHKNGLQCCCIKKVSKTELWNYKIKPIHFARYENRIFKEVCLFIDHFFSANCWSIQFSRGLNSFARDRAEKDARYLIFVRLT